MVDSVKKKGSQVASLCCRYEMPQYGSRRRLLPPAGQEEYGEVIGEAEEEYEEEEVSVPAFIMTRHAVTTL